MAKKPHVSVSQINLYGNCGEAYRRRYVLGEKKPPGIAAIVGRGVDHSVNENLTHKVENGEVLPTEAVLDIARDGFEKSWQEGVMLSDKEVQEGTEKVRGKGIDKTVRLAGLHSGHFAPHIEPISTAHIQRWWRIEIPQLPRDLIGVMDVQEKGLIRDTKTAGRMPTVDAAANSLQGSAYVTSARINDGERVEFQLDYLVDKKQPAAMSLRAGRTDAMLETFLLRVQTAVEGIEAGLVVPANPDHWMCSLRWCGYAPTCPYFHGKKLISLSS